MVAWQVLLGIIAHFYLAFVDENANKGKRAIAYFE